MNVAATKPEELLSKVDLFSGLSHRELKKLVGRAKTVNHATGHLVAAEGLGGLAFHLVLSGRASVQAGGREVSVLGPGEYFGEISMIDGRPRSASVVAAEPLTTLAVPHALFVELLEEEPAFALGLLKTLCARLRSAEKPVAS